MSALKGDFVGFSFNGVHSSELGIMRVNDSSRHSQVELPSMQDKTLQVPGSDGAYFFNTNYTTRQIQISIAFDHVTDAQLRKMRQLFGGKDIGDLIFDEEPYKIYRVKLSSPYSIKEVCFLDEKGERVYKGEGSLSFVSYEPYARGRWHFLDEVVTFSSKIAHVFQNVLTLEYTRGLDLDKPLYIEDYGKVDIDFNFNVHLTTMGPGDALYHNHILVGDNVDIALRGSITEFDEGLVGKRVWQIKDEAGDNFTEWVETSGVIRNPRTTLDWDTFTETYTIPGKSYTSIIKDNVFTFNFKIWNGGDVPVPFVLESWFTTSTDNSEGLDPNHYTLSIQSKTNTQDKLIFKDMRLTILNASTTELHINTKSRLSHYTVVGNFVDLLDSRITEGDYFFIPVGTSEYTITFKTDGKEAFGDKATCHMRINYDYLYY